MTAAVPVTYLFCRECPSYDAGLRLLREAAGVAGVTLDLTVHEVRDDQDARARAFPGSPTYLVAGTDIADPPEGVPYAASSCRAYVRPDGRVGPLPDIRRLVDALRRAGGADPEDA